MGTSFFKERANTLAIRIREVLKELPGVCGDFIHSIDSTTQPLTRYAYACDLKLFCSFLVQEIPSFADRKIKSLTCDDFAAVTVRDIRTYMDYLEYYFNGDDERTNSDVGKMRKMSSLRSFYDFMIKESLIDSDPTRLVALPKRHLKPIIRLEVDEAARLLDIVENGSTENMSARQRNYNLHTKQRDLAIITLFLGTGIRVSELVGLNISDIDFDLNAFLVTRKGGNQMILYMADEVVSVLKAYVEYRLELESLEGHEDALFLSLQKRRITVRAVENLVKKYATAAAPLKRKLSPHKLRSTFGTNLYHETGDIYLVADVLGHSDVNTTKKHYADMSDERRRMAARHVHLRDEKARTQRDENNSADDDEENND